MVAEVFGQYQSNVRIVGYVLGIISAITENNETQRQYFISLPEFLDSVIQLLHTNNKNNAILVKQICRVLDILRISSDSQVQHRIVNDSNTIQLLLTLLHEYKSNGEVVKTIVLLLSHVWNESITITVKDWELYMTMLTDTYLRNTDVLLVIGKLIVTILHHNDICHMFDEDETLTFKLRYLFDIYLSTNQQVIEMLLDLFDTMSNSVSVKRSEWSDNRIEKYMFVILYGINKLYKSHTQYAERLVHSCYILLQGRYEIETHRWIISDNILDSLIGLLMINTPQPNNVIINELINIISYAITLSETARIYAVFPNLINILITTIDCVLKIDKPNVIALKLMKRLIDSDEHHRIAFGKRYEVELIFGRYWNYLIQLELSGNYTEYSDQIYIEIIGLLFSYCEEKENLFSYYMKISHFLSCFVSYY